MSSIGENLCLFSSQFPSLLLFRELKLVEVHHERLKHAWLQDNKLDETTVLTVWPVKRLFSLSMELAELKFSSLAKTEEAMMLNKIWSENIIFSAGYFYLWARDVSWYRCSCGLWGGCSKLKRFLINWGPWEAISIKLT